MSTATHSPLKRRDFFAHEAVRTQLARALAIRDAMGGPRGLRRQMLRMSIHGEKIGRRALLVVIAAMGEEARKAVRLARQLKAERERDDE